MKTYDEKMEEWSEKYPFAAVMMSNIPIEDKLQYAERRFPKHD